MPHLPDLPLSDPVLIFALAMVVFLVVPLVFERMRIPGLIGLILAGAVIGDKGVGLLQLDNTIKLFGTVGLLYLMFLVGLELDIAGVRRQKSHTIVFGLLSFGLPLGLGIAVAVALGYPLRSATLIGAMLSSHTSVAYPIASRLGIVKAQAVTTALGATLIVDLLALLVLAIVSKTSGGSLDVAFWIGLFGPLALYVAAVLVVVPRITKWFFRAASAEGSTEYLFTLAVLFSFSYLAHLAGIEPVIGALLVGFALNNLIPEHGPLMNRIKFVAEAIFVPFFLLSVGMLINVRAFADPDAWLAIGAIVTVAVVAKGLAALITTKVFGYSGDEGKVMFGLSVSRAAATIAIALVGYRLGVIDESVVNAIAVMILVSCIVGPWAVQRFGREVAIREEQQPHAQAAAPDRILIPIANVKTGEALLDLGFILRGDSHEPLFPLMVVTDEEDAEAKVVDAEKILRHAMVYAAGADVEVHPLTRLDPNAAGGISRAIAETRSTMVVVGWGGSRVSSLYGIQRIFGTVLDQLLDQTKQMVIVAKLAHPLNTTDRVVLLLPPASIHHPRFHAAAQVVKRLSQSLGASMLGMALEDDPEKVREALAEVRPNVPVSVVGAKSWRHALVELEQLLTPNDLVVVLSARHGMISWHPKLERLPRQIDRLAPASFLVVYPGMHEPVPSPEVSLVDAWPSWLAPGRVASSLEEDDWKDAIRQTLRAHFEDEGEIEEVVAAIIQSHDDFSAELRPGIVLPHARIPDLESPLVFLGVSEKGIAFPHTPNPAHLMFVLLSPSGEPQQHLRALADIAQVVRSDDQIRQILRLAAIEPEPIMARIEAHDPAA